ncbi:MAG: hypothetical protein WCO29_07450 [Nostocales cyanobacterium ELA583]|jgi:hypothetical protein
MKRTIGIGLMVLSVYLYNSSACFAGNKLSRGSTEVGIEKNTQSQLVVVMSARDEQSGDCIRKGDCKD